MAVLSFFSKIQQNLKHSVNSCQWKLSYNYVNVDKFEKKKKREYRDDSEFTNQYFINYLSYRIFL